jgi:hypothetical protein
MKSTTAIILILISVGLYYTVLSPQYASVMSLRERQGQYADILNNVTELEQKRNVLLAKYKAIPPEEVDRLDKVLPDRIDTVNLARDFDLIAARHGITIKSISTETDQANNVGAITTDSNGAPVVPGAPGMGSSAGPALQKVNLSLEFIATYQNFKQFLNDLEMSVRIADVSNLTFTVAENGLNQYSMTLTTYWLK